MTQQLFSCKMMSDEQAQKFHTVDQNGRKNSMNNREVLLEVRGHHNKLIIAVQCNKHI